MSDTPRTDARVRTMIENDIAPDGLEHFARDLERELAAWKAYAERLERAGDTLATVTLRNGNSHGQWHAAKETKP